MSREIYLPCAGSCLHDNNCYDQVSKDNEMCKQNILLAALPSTPSFVGYPDENIVEIYLGDFKKPLAVIKDGEKVEA